MKLEGQVRIPSGCAISAVISREGRRMTGEDIIRSMVPMHDRSNGLGGGFAAYGIYPEHREEYAFHIFFDDNTTRRECEAMLKEGFELVDAELIPIRIIPEITDIPHIWRYFVRPLNSVLARLQLDEKEFVARTVMDINTKLKGAYVFSSGKNMGTFKAVGYPEDVGRFYRLEEYEGYTRMAASSLAINTLSSFSAVTMERSFNRSFSAISPPLNPRMMEPVSADICLAQRSWAKCPRPG